MERDREGKCPAHVELGGFQQKMPELNLIVYIYSLYSVMILELNFYVNLRQYQLR